MDSKTINKIVTFYSYKGGVGRSQLLANLAAYLCYYENKKVLMIDWDLEAPGLDYFFKFDRRKIKKGLIEVFEDYINTVKGSKEIEPNDLPNFEHCIYRIDTTRNGGALDLIPSANYNQNDYSHRISTFDWFDFYNRLEGKYYIEYLKEYLNTLDYNTIFIDSRTGISDYLGICNIQLPEKNVIVVAASKQNIDGSYEVVKKIKESPYTNEVRKTPFILPIFSRIDTTEQEQYKEWRVEFEEKFSETITTSTKNRNASNIISETTIIYTTNLAYGEKVLFEKRQARIIAESVEEKFINILAELDLAEKVNKKIPKNLTPPPFLSEVFLGREDELMALHKKLFLDDNLLLLINGIGGVGKTTLAAKYYHAYANEYAHLAWVINEKSIANALLLLAAPLGISFEDIASVEGRVEQILQAMASIAKPSLLVIDNANEISDLEGNYYILRRLSNFHILLTTRISGFAKAATFQVGALPYEEALQLFTEYYTGHKAIEDELFMQVYNAIGGNTLVIELLAKNLEVLNAIHTQYSLTQLVGDLQKGLLKVSQSRPVNTLYHSEALFKGEPLEIIAAMYDIGELQAIEKRLLSVMAVLPSENISFATLQALLPATTDPADTLANLSRKGWIEHDREKGIFKISPVVQEIAKMKNIELLDDCKELIDSLIDKLDYEQYTGHFLNTSYAEALKYARYGETISAQFIQIDDKLAILADRIGRYHQTTGNLPKALQFYKTYSKLSEMLNSKNPDNEDYKNQLAISYRKLGEAYASMGNLKEALRFYTDETTLFHQLYDAYPDNVAFKNGLAISYEKLGQTYADMGNLNKALQFYEDQSRLAEQLFDDYPDNVAFKNGLAVSYSKLGQTHADMGNLNKALQFYELRSELGKQLFDDYPDNVAFKNGLAISFYKLGTAYEANGDMALKKQYFQQAQALWQQLAADFPDYAEFGRNLGIVNDLLEQG